MEGRFEFGMLGLDWHQKCLCSRACGDKRTSFRLRISYKNLHVSLDYFYPGLWCIEQTMHKT